MPFPWTHPASKQISSSSLATLLHAFRGSKISCSLSNTVSVRQIFTTLLYVMMIAGTNILKQTLKYDVKRLLSLQKITLMKVWTHSTLA